MLCKNSSDTSFVSYNFNIQFINEPGEKKQDEQQLNKRFFNV